MERKILLENIEVFCDSPNGVEVLRTAILDLAVSGKLVSQLPNAKCSLEKSGCEGPFTIPSEWSWHPLPNVTNDLGQLKPESPFTYIDVSSIDNKKGVISNDVLTISPEDAPSRARKRVQVGSVIYSTVRPYLKNIAVVDQVFEPPAIASTAFAILNPSVHLDTRYLYYCLRSTYFTDFVESKQKGVAYPAINAGDLAKSLIPLPPLEEQARIVSAVEELLKICEQLQLKLDSQNLLGAATRKSAVDAIATAQSPEDFQIAWERVQQNLDVVAGTPEAVDSMRTLILDLAVRGDLVRVNNPKVFRAVNWTTSELRLDDSKLWNLPTLHKETKHGWNRIPLAKIGSWGSGGTPTSSRKDYYQNGTIPWAVIGDLNNDVMTTTETSITDKALLDSSSKIVPTGAILIAMYGASIGKTAIAGIECCTNQAIAHCIVDENLVSKEYFFIVAKSLKRHLIQAGKGAAQPNISQSVLKHLVIDLPPLAEQALIVDRVEELMQLCDRLSHSLRASEVLAEKFSRSVVSASA